MHCKSMRTFLNNYSKCNSLYFRDFLEGLNNETVLINVK